MYHVIQARHKDMGMPFYFHPSIGWTMDLRAAARYRAYESANAIRERLATLHANVTLTTEVVTPQSHDAGIVLA